MLLATAYIQMRASKNSLPVTYAIDENLTFGNQGANLLSIMATEWFEVKPSDSEFTDEKIGLEIGTNLEVCMVRLK